ncbi:MAG: GntR family transcriptional regulator [Paramuribaculum sp.]|nr:GntR family transcriptional regulator [Paramuribaculum sp.]
MKIGNYNMLRVSRTSDYGIYLVDEAGHEVLLPSRYVTEEMKEGSDVEVFVYNDSEDRPVATTERPVATVGEFAFLSVKAVNRIGAFLDWGLMKDLLVPYNQQQDKMTPGRAYPVYIYLDDASKRIVASARIGRFLGNLYPDLKRGQKVDVLIYKRTPIGYACIVDNAFKGMLYSNELFRPVEIGNRLEAFVKGVREDGKIDLTLGGDAASRSASLAEKIEAYMRRCGGSLDLGDHSSPEVIRFRFQCSKKDFKKALGLLLKEGKIAKDADGYALLTP